MRVAETDCHEGATVPFRRFGYGGLLCGDLLGAVRRQQRRVHRQRLGRRVVRPCQQQ